VGGAEGVARVLDTLRDELAADAGLCGITEIGAVPADTVVGVA
jgi:isopentenyl diphosphate isomerase/L-lactate dehydrogenase-like FMN-dependent dehydrogenase